MATSRSTQSAAGRRRAAGSSRSQAARAARRGSSPARRRAASPGRGREIAALICIALAVYLVFVLYFGWHGGFLGSRLVLSLRVLFGVLAYLAPFVLIYAAYVLAAKPGRRPSGEITAGVVVLLLAFALAAAADSFGLFGGTRPGQTFAVDYVKTHGGVTGESLWAGLHIVIGRVGVDILVAAAVIAGLLLVSGSSLGLWASRSKRGVAAARRAARRSAELSAQTLGTRRAAALEHQSRTAAWETRAGPTRGPHDRSITLIDGARDLPDIYVPRGPAAGGPAAPVASPFSGHGPAPIDEVLDDDPGEQLSLADEAEEAGEGAGALAFEQTVERQWLLPDPGILERTPAGEGETQAVIASVAAQLTETLGHFGVEARVINTISGPRVTQYELQLAPGTKVSRVASLKDDIAYALAATEIRVQAPIPGKSAVGVEVPNRQPNWVSLGDIHGDLPVNASPLAVWLGKDITGKPVLADLTRLIHVLIAGTTGSGKSACLNSIVSAILLRATPDQVRFIMIDPKKVELSHFDGVPHLLAPVVTNIRNAGGVLATIVHEMERRYELMQRSGNARDIRELNRKLVRAGEKPLPYVVIVMDELADLMMVAPAEVEHAVIRLGQLARAVGMHLVVATQRPSVDVVTGLIKTNIPSRIAFKVSSQTDSRVILDAGGAESLLGDGDMLFHPYSSAKMLRVQGAFISSEEMKVITDHWRAQAEPDYHEDLLESATGDSGDGAAADDMDPMLAEAITTVVRNGAASVALLQRRLRVGYARAGRLIDMMEERAIISGFDGSKARKVLIDEDDLPRILGTGSRAASAARPVSEPTLGDEAVEPASSSADEYAGEPLEE
jgi:S-DNA-T family DNA segregation ATPase FtsK/SpoIIIE